MNLVGPMSKPQPVVTNFRGGPNRGSSTREPLRVIAASSNPSPLHARLVIQKVLEYIYAYTRTCINHETSQGVYVHVHLYTVYENA